MLCPDELREVRLFMLWMILFVALGWLGGWIHAHNTVAKECQRLGRFYVGSTTYECTAITDRKPQP
ncbi:hypothetical protein TUM20286_05490 [Pseudomonas tohonis]|uniref:Uncharacterized protein n=1 Tax=Pseudomonas tohonis TaxID=2725477 RepID=A0ABQ4VSW8_9PSED|nr:hypothetical protein TUM20286_05490 [Pseudomonas tohonis]